MQRLRVYRAHPERPAPRAQRRCGLNIRDIVLYYHFTLWIHAVAPQLNVGQGPPPTPIPLHNHLFLIYNPFCVCRRVCFQFIFPQR
jgi:hypothetical protein